MSEATREKALMHAINFHANPKAAPPDPAEVAATAELFNSFITDDSTTTPAKPTATKPKPAATKPKATKPAATAPEETEEENGAGEAEETTDEGEGPTKEDVGNAIASLINANLSAECAKLLKKFGAKSLSGIKPEKYAAFVSEAETLLMNA